MKYLLLLTLLLAGCGAYSHHRGTANPAAEEPAAVVDEPAASPFDQFKSTVVWCANLAAVASAGLLLGGAIAMFGLRLPFGKDLLAVGGIALLASGSLALFVEYAGWTIGATLVGFGGYFMYLMYTRITEAQVQTELVESAEYLKQVTDWNEPVKDRLRLLQSPVTKKVVDRIQGKIK